MQEEYLFHDGRIVCKLRGKKFNCKILQPRTGKNKGTKKLGTFDIVQFHNTDVYMQGKTLKADYMTEFAKGNVGCILYRGRGKGEYGTKKSHIECGLR